MVIFNTKTTRKHEQPWGQSLKLAVHHMIGMFDDPPCRVRMRQKSVLTDNSRVIYCRIGTLKHKVRILERSMSS